MPLQGSALSLQARRVLNATVRDWLLANANDLDETCVVAELLNGRHKTAGICVLRERLIYYLRSQLYVQGRQRPDKCLVTRFYTVPPDKSWKPISTTMLALVLNMNHSSFVTRTKVSK